MTERPDLEKRGPEERDLRDLELRCDAYLDGDLPRDEALAFERDLAVRPELAEALASALALRELLAALPPLAPPPGLSARIARALPLRRERKEKAAAAGEPSPAGAVLAGISWLYRVPAMAAQGVAGSAATAGAGLSQVRWALGPLGAQVPGFEPEPRPRPRRPLWRRLLFGRAKR